MNWFTDWFNSPYYDILYKHRDDHEAHSFIRALFRVLPIRNAPRTILDLACGNGRHAQSLSEFGSVTGLDINPLQIQKAQQRKLAEAEFAIHDMRDLYKATYFDYVLNLFSSFGYFDEHSENQQSILQVAASLKPGGIFIQDFLNYYYVKSHLKEEETQEMEGVIFTITRKIEGAFIIKNISVYNTQNGERLSFYEKVRGYTVKELRLMHKKAGLSLVSLWGDYDLQSFNLKESPRVILVSTKPLSV